MSRWFKERFVHTLFSLLLRARSCFQGGPVCPSPSQPTLSSFSEGVGLGITHDIKPITCHRKKSIKKGQIKLCTVTMHAFLLQCDLEHLMQALCNRGIFDQEVQVQACVVFSPARATRKRKSQEGASGGRSTALSLCWIQRHCSICLSASTADSIQKSRKGWVAVLGYTDSVGRCECSAIAMGMCIKQQIL